jgi:hypothetical protein
MGFRNQCPLGVDRALILFLKMAYESPVAALSYEYLVLGQGSCPWVNRFKRFFVLYLSCLSRYFPFCLQRLRWQNFFVREK